MKLSEPQKRVLKTMAELDCKVTVRRGYAMNLVRFLEHGDVPAPSAAIVHTLCRRGLLVPNRERHRFTIYRLTPKGREVAKEL